MRSDHLLIQLYKIASKYYLINPIILVFHMHNTAVSGFERSFRLYYDNYLSISLPI